jgi:DNA-binding FadR family transcriptional regulator
MQLEAIERLTMVDLVVDQTARVIKERKLAAGSRLPGVHELVEQLQVNQQVNGMSI